MKKIYIFFILFLSLTTCNVSLAYEMDEYYLLDPYSVNDHNLLIELYDDLRGLYEDACEDASSFESDISELEDKVEEQKWMIEQLEYKLDEQSEINTSENEYSYGLLVFIFVVLMFPYLISKLIEFLNKNKK